MEKGIVNVKNLLTENSINNLNTFISFHGVEVYPSWAKAIFSKTFPNVNDYSFKKPNKSKVGMEKNLESVYKYYSRA